MYKLNAALTSFFLIASCGVASALPTASEEHILMESARHCEYDGNLEEANKLYARVLAMNGKSYKALIGRMTNFVTLGQYKDALNEGNKYVALFHDQESYLHRGWVLIEMGNAEAALADLDKCVPSYTSPMSAPYICVSRSIACLLSGRYEQARTWAYAHLTTSPRSILSPELCAVTDAVSARPAEALSKISLFLYTDAHGGSAWHSPTKEPLYNQWPLSKLHSAAELKEPRFQTLYRSWAESHFRQGVLNDRERAQLIALLNAHHSGLTPAQLNFAKAVIYFFQQDYERSLAEAALCASGGTKLYSNVLTFYCHLEMRDLEKAEKDLNGLISLFPDSQYALDAIDLYYYQTAKRQAGVSEIKALLAHNPRNEAAMAELAKVCHDLNQLDEALKYCNMALQLDPGNANLLLLKAKILTSKGNNGEGLAVLSPLIAKDRKNGAAHLARAAIYTQEKKWSQAIDDLTQAIHLKYDLVKSYRVRAACYGAARRPDLASKDLEAIKPQDP